jgi:D-tyrosyl-tRNA(Tyr) deacylase
MRVLIQRAHEAHVKVGHVIVGEIRSGLLVFVGIEESDNNEDIEWISGKIVNLRIFDDESQVPNLSLKDTAGGILLISQFTLHALTQKGNRPSYIRAARPENALKIYEQLIRKIEMDLQQKIQTGIFGAHMDVSLINNGPITIWIDSKNKE